jgi:hypothetical protein
MYSSNTEVTAVVTAVEYWQIERSTDEDSAYSEQIDSCRISSYILLSWGVGGSEVRACDVRKHTQLHVWARTLTCVYSFTFGWPDFELIVWRNLRHSADCETREPNYWYLGSRLGSVSFTTIYYVINFVSPFWEGSLISDPASLTFCACLVLLHSRNHFWHSNCLPLSHSKSVQSALYCYFQYLLGFSFGCHNPYLFSLLPSVWISYEYTLYTKYT